MKYLLAIIFTVSALTTQAAPHERLVLMPVHVPAADAALAGAIEAVVAEGLSHRYTVLSGERVANRTRQIFTQGACDETECLQRVARAFKSERVAVVNVVLPDQDYFVSVSVRNVLDDYVEKSASITCRYCDIGEVIARLKDLFVARPGEMIAQPEPLWTLAPTAMTWKDAREYCISVGAHLPSLAEFNELHNTADMTALAMLQIGGPIWSTASDERGTHYLVAPMRNTMMPWADVGKNFTACIR